MSDALLPKGFEDLRHLGDWIVPTEEGRHKRKIAADIETARGLYATVFPRMEAIVQHLNGVAWETMGEADRNLFWLASMCMEVSHPVELGWQTTDIADAFPTGRVQFLSESAGY
jgi:hypothetical protein